ncbi:hypothetical protein FGL98_05010 [Leekyejoonella antrihumi]|uniref:DUF4131 domain-containing protein n=1 Tax=Leekyejoonella antrihumi TaxID=1660198 RepID=A0A563E4W9_9MICO|nr:hypothetical protein FGL98_05010 [Leekyejoonella antrihumi]
MGRATDATPPVAPSGLDLRLLVAASATWVAVLCALGWPPGLILVLAVGFAVLATVAVVVSVHRRWDRSTHPRLHRAAPVVGLAAICCTLGLVATAGHLLTREAGTVQSLAQAHATVRVQAVVVSDPRALGSQGRFGEDLVITRVSVRMVEGRGQVSTPHTPVLVMGDASWLRVHWHERVTFAGRLSPAEPGDDVEALINPRGEPHVVGRPGALTRGIEDLRGSFRASHRTFHLIRAASFRVWWSVTPAGCQRSSRTTCGRPDCRTSRPSVGATSPLSCSPYSASPVGCASRTVGACRLPWRQLSSL